jgi:hypothetical protein
MLVTKPVEYAEPMMTMHQERYSFQMKRDIKNLSRMNLIHKRQLYFVHFLAKLVFQRGG